MKWVLKRGIGISRTAGIWLVRKRIDPSAEFVYFDDDGRAREGARAVGAKTIHVKGGDFFGHDGHTTVGRMLDHYGLRGTDPALDLWSEIIRDAEGPLRRGEPSHPEAFGFYCLVIGYRELDITEEERTELVLLECEAMYQWCRKVIARDIVPPRTSPHGEPPRAAEDAR